eukprot:GEMP01021616.1.p1 GENE.GEMP01021616.1~~GEMP01021616.1.p1  ORF type:complete len:684 (+),score=216.20 GEMP01021616.1:89-2053(+)
MKLFGLLVLGAAVTPTQKVVQMLGDMAAKGKQEKQEEEVRFSRFQQWWENTSKDRQRAIAEGNRRIEQLSADIQKAEADASRLGKEIEELQSNIAQFEADKKAATEIRTKEHSDYQTTHKDYSESIDALQRAVVVLKQQNFDRTQAESLLQVSKLKMISMKDKRAIISFLEKSDEPDFLNRSAPEANAYEFQSGGVIDMLKKLLDKFVDEKRALEKEESDKRHSYEMLVQDLTDQIENSTSQSKDRAETKSQREADGAEAKGDLADTTAVRDEDQKYLTDLNAEHQQKTSDYENRQKLRGEELDAIKQAVEILSSASVSGAAEKHLPQLAQTSFVQLRLSQDSPLQQRVASFLVERADASNSRLLSMVATQVADNPFEKVKRMIRDMVYKLQEEATEETEHKGWCDAELSANKVARDAKTDEVETLTARADSLTARIAKLTQEIADLSAAIANIDASVDEATKNRNEENVKNTQSVADAKEAQVAVSRALTILREFYDKAAAATSLVQGPAEDAPETFDKSYQGMQSESGGVVGMLEVIQSDFARLESETSAAEAQAADEFKTFTNDSEVDKAVKTTEMNHRESSKQQAKSKLNATKKDLAGSQEELDAANTYYDKLKPTCVDSGATYEDRVARRAEEIQSLKEALRILTGEDA